MKLTPFRRPVALIVVLMLSACTDSPTTSEPHGAELAPIQLSANVSGTPISTLVVSVRAMNIDPPLVFNLEAVSGIAQGTLEIPVGANRIFDVRAYDTSGEVTHEGSTTVNVSRGGNPPISIPLTPVRGEVEVVIQMGDYSVVVTPASASMGAGQTRQLTATITAPNGDPVTDAPVWATLNPSIATVDTSGLVSAVGPGTVDIVATYAGVAGRSVITVSGGATTTWFHDADEDQFGDPAVSTESSTQPAGYVDNDLDCDDSQPSVNPDAVEVADGQDNDCNGQVDEMSSSTGMLAFVSNRDGDNDIYVMNADGSGLIPLTMNSDSDDQPIWSPDGTKLAFRSFRDGNAEIYVMDANGSNVTNLTTNPGQDANPVWSHDGTMIAFESDRDGNNEIYVMGVNGSNPLNLTNNPAVDGQPGWSPDDTQIAFTSSRNGNDDIYVMGSDGAGLLQLTVNAFDDSDPAWSPTGAVIAYVAGDTVESGLGPVSVNEIAVILPDGSGRTMLTANENQFLFDLAWSPDGTKILHAGGNTRFTSGFGTETTVGIAVVDADGTNHTGLSSVTGTSTTSPAWSPDGTMIVFVSDRSGDDEIYMMNADGSGATNLTMNPSDDSGPAW